MTPAKKNVVHTRVQTKKRNENGITSFSWLWEAEQPERLCLRP
jgi:hypothetical protein